jgi:lysophospholipase L1-like esterase
MGGSTVYGQGVREPKESLPGKLRDALQKSGFHGDKKLEVINTGVGGYSSPQELLYLINDIHAYQPDVVVVYDGWNDQHYIAGLINVFGDRFGSFRTSEHFKMETIVDDYFNGRRDVPAEFAKLSLTKLKGVALFDIALGFLKRQGVGVPEDDKLKDKVRDEEIMALFSSLMRNPKNNEIVTAAKLYERNLALMIAAGRIHGFKVAVFLQPLLGVDEKKMSENELKTYHAVPKQYWQIRSQFYENARQSFSRLAQENRGPAVRVVDLSRLFKGRAEELYVDIGHINARGNELVASAIRDTIIGF